ncbi:hypothetical protein C9374_010886 [Naegleria lovaniensis]|uniref:Uncharacterized protein n=1 Tax=Naegleria lovaniensis TaxID=51637 RepID=A0AA88KFR4_NAELO|nr:uncharacterized protein C9374_010886 [Naegleria lovaniensis]KAG2374316.1 hypothetical protein C9374_010886 [Naegleria lovaniensis]
MPKRGTAKEAEKAPTIEEQLQHCIAEVQNKALEIEGLKAKTKALQTYKEMYEKLKQEHDAFVEELKHREAESIQVANFLRKDLELKNRTILQHQKDLSENTQHHKQLVTKLEKQLEEAKQRFSEDLLTKDTELLNLEKALSLQDELKKELEKYKQLYHEKEQENEQIRKFFDAELTKSKQIFIKETMRSRKEESGIQEQFEREVEERALQLIDEKSRSIYEQNILLKAQLEECQQELRECSQEKEKYKQENKNLTRTIEMNKDLLKEYTKQCFNLSKELRTMNQKYDTEKVFVDLEKRFNEEKHDLKEKYEQQIKDLEKKRDELSKILQIRNRELNHIRKIGKKLLEQRTELEMFFNEALGTVKEQLKNPPSSSNVVTYAKTQVEELRGQTNQSLPPISKSPVLPPDQQPPQPSFPSLSWQDKEKVLKILFDKINGIPSKNQNSQQTNKHTSNNSFQESPKPVKLKLQNSLASLNQAFRTGTPSSNRSTDFMFGD